MALREVPCAAPSASASTTASAPAPAPSPLPPVEFLEQRLADAYAARARGDVEKARADFDSLAALLIAAGWKRSVGLGGDDVVAGRSKAALTIGYNTLFFDPDSGEPFAFAPGVELLSGAPSLDGGLFAAKQGLFDPVSAEVVDLPGLLIALHPDGDRAYLLGEDCRLTEYSLERREVAAKLAPHTRQRRADDEPRWQGGACGRDAFKDAIVTADGKWLTTGLGRWNLKTRIRWPLPFRWNPEDYRPAVSPDGRYVAHIIRNPRARKDAPGTYQLLALYDLDVGTMTTTMEPFNALTNPDPLSFRTPPVRVCVSDFGVTVFEIPSLRKFEPGDGVMLPTPPGRPFGDCNQFAPPPAEPPEAPGLGTRLAQRIFFIGDLPFPIER